LHSYLALYNDVSLKLSYYSINCAGGKPIELRVFWLCSWGKPKQSHTSLYDENGSLGSQRRNISMALDQLDWHWAASGPVYLITEIVKTHQDIRIGTWSHQHSNGASNKFSCIKVIDVWHWLNPTQYLIMDFLKIQHSILLWEVPNACCIPNATNRSKWT
jgi:hypothetical protein